MNVERVLVVDDSRQIRVFVADYILRPRGFDVMLAENATRALEIAETHKLDLIITDLMMPEISGLELLEQLRGRGQMIPAILMTAYGSEQAAIQALRLGVRDYVIKPFEVSEMVDAINRALRETRLERERNQLARRLIDSTAALQQRVQEFSQLRDIEKAIISSLDLQEVLNRIVEAAVQISAADTGVLMLRETENDLYVRAVKRADARTEAKRVKTRDPLALKVVASQEPIVVGNGVQWEHVRADRQVKALVYVPLTLVEEKEVLGVLGVARQKRAASFNGREVEVMQTLAEFAATAIQNARLYTQSDVARRQLYATLSQTDAPVLLVDERDRIIMVNEGARTALGLPAGDLVGQVVAQQITDDKTAAFLSELLALSEDQRAEFEGVDGRAYAIQMNLIEDVGRSFVMSDVTRLKEMTREQSEFVSTVSHDLRSPLTAIKGYVDLLQRTGPLSDTQSRFVGRVQEGISLISAMITDLLDLGRLESGADLTLMPCQLDVMLREIVEELHVQFADKDQRITLDFPSQLPPIMGDPVRLRRAFDNLISNASKYTPNGGEIACRVRTENGRVVVEIKDTGIGIAPQDQAQIFEKFYRADAVRGTHQGTGLGLSIVKSVLERHGGHITLESEVGQGTTFMVTLPVANFV